MELLCTLHVCGNKSCKSYNQLIPFLVKGDERDKSLCYRCGRVIIQIMDEVTLQKRIKALSRRKTHVITEEGVKAWKIFADFGKRRGWTFPDGLYRSRQFKSIEKCLQMGCELEDFEGCYRMVLSWGFDGIDFTTLASNMNRYLNTKRKVQPNDKYSNRQFMQ